MERNFKLIHKGEYTELSITTDGPSKTVRKLSPYPANRKLLNEAVFIRDVIPDTAKKHFPTILSTRKTFSDTCNYYYDMTYYPGPLLREKLINPDVSQKEVINDISSALLALQNLYERSVELKPEKFVQSAYLGRVRERLKGFTKTELKDVAGITGELPEQDVRTVFNQLVSSESTIINDETILSPLAIIETISRSEALLKKLTPPRTSMALIHGDPHLGNILITSGRPIFLDPNGFNEGGDIAYDIAKFILSLEHLDPLYEGLLVSPRIEMKLGKITVDKLKKYKILAFDKRIGGIYQTVLEDVLPKIFAEKIKSDNHLIDRALFVAKLHALACAHTFIPNKREISLHLFLYYLMQLNIYFRPLIK